MNPVALLKKQHREVDALVEKFEHAEGADEKEAIFLEIAARLVAHDAIEREIFYPACERLLGPSEPLMEGIAEHGLIEFSIFRADKARKKDSFDYLVSVLAEMVQHHVEEEEAEVLAKVSKKMDAAMAKELGEKMLARFEESMAGDFRAPLRKNLEQVIGGRTKTTPPPKPRARTAAAKRTARGAKRTVRGGKRTPRGKRLAASRR